MRRQLSLSAARAVVEQRIAKRRQREQVLKQRGITPKRLIKARKDRAEDAVEQRVRAQCVKRDGWCRIFSDVWGHSALPAWTCCDGESEWAHFDAQRRARTRGMDPEARHTTAGSLMLCTRHHTAYDAHRLLITARTKSGCDGPLAFAATPTLQSEGR